MSDNDLISREALKKVIETYRPILITSDYLQGKNNMIDYCIAEIDNAPTVEPNCEGCTTWSKSTELLKKRLSYLERPKDKWIVTEVKCPECLEFFQTDCYSREEMSKCPCCGADMRGDK